MGRNTFWQVVRVPDCVRKCVFAYFCARTPLTDSAKVTPKLLQDLTYTEDMVVLVVFNGCYNMKQTDWDASMRRVIGAAGDDDF